MSEATTIVDAFAVLDDALIHAHAAHDQATIDGLVAELAQRLDQARACAKAVAR
jgi:hypothetical protein